jgi:uncharacterized protein
LGQRETVDQAAPPAPQIAPGAARAAKRWRLRRILRSLLLIYLLVCVGVYLIQGWLIFPGRFTQNSAEAQIPKSPDSEIVHLHTADGTPVVGLFGSAWVPPRPATQAGQQVRHPAAIYFYGNAMSANGCWKEFESLRELGLSTIVAEYAGYGMSGGKPTEASLYATADSMYDYLLSRADIDPHRIIAVGWSLGSAVATDLASRRPVAGLAIFSAFTSLPDMAQAHYWFLPARWLVRYQFDNLAKFRTLKCPVFLCHGTHDEIVPFEMSKQLSAAAPPQSITRLEVDTGHNDIFDAAGWQIWPALGKWLNTSGITK